jgi:hypothetical protein
MTASSTPGTTSGVSRKGHMRYRLLASLRDYGAERLAETGERDARLLQHAEYYATEAVQIDDVRRTDWQHWRQEGWSWLTAEQENIRAVLGHCGDGSIDAMGQTEMGLRLCASVCWFWLQQDRWVEAWDWLHSLLSATPARVTPARFFAVWYAGIFGTGQRWSLRHPCEARSRCCRTSSRRPRATCVRRSGSRRVCPAEE